MIQISGWDVATLQQIIDNCDAGDAGMDKCPNLIGGLNDPGNSCNIQSPVNEVIDGVIEKLPGNNPLGQWGVAAQVGSSPPPASQPPVPLKTSSKPAATAPGAGGSPLPKSSTAAGGPGGGSGGYPTKTTTTEPGKQPTSPPKTSPSTSKGPGKPAPAPTNTPHGGNDGPSNSLVTSYVSETTLVYTTVTAPAPGPSDSSLVADGWSYDGCYADKKGNGLRVLSGITFANVGQHAVTNTKCVAYCAKAGFTMAGTEFGGQCFCGNELVGSSKADESQCNVPCEGDASQTCGGKLTLSVYKTSNVKRRSHLHRHLHGRTVL